MFDIDQLALLQQKQEDITKAANIVLAKLGEEGKMHAAQASAIFAMAQQLALAVNAAGAQLEGLTKILRDQHEANLKAEEAQGDPSALPSNPSDFL